MDDEDYEPPVNRMLRGKALDKALSFIAASRDSYTSEAVLDVAQAFYDFLKGDDK